jgi:hypothetical protein
MAISQGVDAEGPVMMPAELEAAILRGFEAVEQGRPYVIDVLVESTIEDLASIKRDSS